MIEKSFLDRLIEKHRPQNQLLAAQCVRIFGFRANNHLGLEMKHGASRSITQRRFSIADRGTAWGWKVAKLSEFKRF